MEPDTADGLWYVGQFGGTKGYSIRIKKVLSTGSARHRAAHQKPSQPHRMRCVLPVGCLPLIRSWQSSR